MPDATERVTDRTLTEGGDSWTATIAYDVINAADERAALAKVPHRVGATHPQYKNLKLQSRTAARKGALDFWLVTLSYTSDPTEPESENPLNRSTTLRWSFERVSEAVDRDAYGNALFNSVNDAIEGVTNDFYALRLDAVEWAPAFPIRQAMTYIGAINGDTFTVAGLQVKPLECVCVGYAPGQEYTETTKDPIPIQKTFLFRGVLDPRPGLSPISAWDFRFLDQAVHGYYVDASRTTTKRPFYIGRDPAPIPVRLDGTGKPLDKNVKVGPEGYEAGTNPTGRAPTGAIRDVMPRGGGATEAVFLTYARHKREKFRGLIRYFK